MKGAYELVDFGHGKRLERFGDYTLIRPDIHAKGKPSLSPTTWQEVHAEFVEASELRGTWRRYREMPDTWAINVERLQIVLRLGSTKQIGIFGEQALQWQWIEERISQVERPVKLLNLFGYTGIASLVAAMAGAEVTYVDASKPAISSGSKNQELSGLSSTRIRWVCEDAVKFTERERRRGNTYDAIILDPPAFGRGPKGEVWQFERDIEALLIQGAKLLSAKPYFLILNAYSDSFSKDFLMKKIRTIFSKYSISDINATDLCLKAQDGRLLDSGTSAFTLTF